MDEWSQSIANILWEKAGIYPYSFNAPPPGFGGEHIINYFGLCKESPRPRHLSVYRHMISLCLEKGLDDIDAYISFVCTMDFVLGYPDRSPDDILFIRGPGNSLTDILPCHTPYCLNYTDQCRMFSNNFESNLLITGVSSALDLHTLDTFPSETESFICENFPDFPKDQRIKIIADMTMRIAFVKKMSRHASYSLDWKHRENDEIRFFLRKQDLSETEDSIADVARTKVITGDNSENSVTLIGNRIKNERMMCALENIRL